MNHSIFKNRQFLLDHLQKTHAFYDGRALDPSGGFYQFFKDDGQVYNPYHRHLVSSTRFVVTHAQAYRQFGHPQDLANTRHALQFLRKAHRRTDGGYHWLLHWDGHQAKVLDANQHCYGLAFVLLAYAHALQAGIEHARTWLGETYTLMEEKFWQAEHGLYADEADGDWRLSPYRGQNANMHACEAMLAAFEACGEPRYLDRAQLIASNITQRQAALADGLIWEHYHADWSIDWEYNRHDPANLFRPWGFQPGHHTEWAKLLLTLERYRPQPGLLERAQNLFERALDLAWDTQYGGIHYGFAPDGQICDADKYHWVQAESLAAAALLGARTGQPAYWQWYERIWAYCWQHFVDHQHGAWYRILGPANQKLTDEKSPAGKVDYHNLGACYEVLNVLET